MITHGSGQPRGKAVDTLARTDAPPRSAVAEPASGTTTSMFPAAQRGPLRPAHLRSVRQRNARRYAAHGFHAVDLIALVGIAAIAHGNGWSGPFLDVSLRRTLPLVVCLVVVVRMLHSLGLYRLGRHERLVHHLAKSWLATGIAIGLGTLTGLLVGSDGDWLRVVLGWGVCAAFALLALHGAWWMFVRRWRRDGWLTPNVVLVGATTHAEELVRGAIEDRSMHVLGIFDDRRERSPYALLGVPVLGDTEALLTHRITPFVDLIVVAVTPEATSRAREISSRLSVLPNNITMIFDSADPASRSAALADMADAPLAPLKPRMDDDRRAFSKRMQDLFIGVPMLVFAAPLMALIALAVRLDSKGPVFFKQRRHGFNNEEITVWKFRTMRHDAADAKAERQVSKDDDRVTRVGRFLRKSSLDELPQLINVVRGEMSLVGPRPHAIGMKSGEVESARLVSEYAHRHRIKPGMTGWAAVNGSRGALLDAHDVARRVTLDVEYIDRQSFWLDMRILVTTLPTMLGDRTAIR